MKAMLLNEAGPVAERPLGLQEIETPQPQPGQVLIQVRMCGVCHTDLHTVQGDIIPPTRPIIPGHQVVGTVVAAGSGVAGIAIGERVGAAWLGRTCGNCAHCRRGEENLCAEAQFTGFHFNGGYAQYLVAWAEFIYKIPEAIPDENVPPLLCAGIIGYRSLKKADLQPNERLALVGFGASAHLAIQVAQAWGCEVYVFSRSEQHRQHALELGAVWAGEIQQEPPHLVDRAVTFAPAGRLVPQTLQKIRPGGTLAINAVHMSPIPEMPYRLIYGERTLRSVANATRSDGVEFLKLAASIPIEPTTTFFPLSAANQALEAIQSSSLNGQAVLVMP